MDCNIYRHRICAFALLFAIGFAFCLTAPVVVNAQQQNPYAQSTYTQPTYTQPPYAQQHQQPQHQQPQYQRQQPSQLQRQPSQTADRRAIASNSGAPAANVATAGIARPSEDILQRRPNEHPLMPTLRWAKTGLQSIEKMHGYTARVVKRERIGGEVGDYEYMYVKVRHRPFSVYMYFLGPPNVKGQEAIYIDGANDGKMWAHGTGLRGLVGTVELKPTSPLAMSGQRYPITELGIQNLVRRLLEVGEKDTKYGECDVSFLENAKINGRSCTCIQVVHPVPRRNFLFHIARIYVDNELNVPIRYEAHDWPKGKDGKPELIEEYTYLDFTPNNNLSDADFDWRNPNYNFISK